MDVTEHPTGEGKVYLAVVLDAFSRWVVGWSVADHMRQELVVDAVQMAICRRRPRAGQTVAHSDHGAQYTSWAFGRRLRAAGLLGSMGSVGDCFDNSAVESFFGSLQLELFDQHLWDTRRQLASAVFEWLEGWYNPSRRHSYCKMLSPVDFEAAYHAGRAEHRPHDPTGPKNGALRCPQRPPIDAGGMNTPGVRGLCPRQACPQTKTVRETGGSSGSFRQRKHQTFCLAR